MRPPRAPGCSSVTTCADTTCRSFGASTPDWQCLDLPILDTLELSAIAFPSNPYHRLVKGYKLVSDSRNDPLKDARLTLDLLREEVDALSEMQRSDPEWVALLHFLLRDEPPLAHLLATLRAAAVPAAADATTIALNRFGPVCCSTRLSRFGDRRRQRWRRTPHGVGLRTGLDPGFGRQLGSSHLGAQRDA